MLPAMFYKTTATATATAADRHNEEIMKGQMECRWWCVVCERLFIMPFSQFPASFRAVGECYHIVCHCLNSLTTGTCRNN